MDEKIIKCLRDDGRITMKNLGEEVHLTGQTVKKQN
ncbi:AsnC family protein [Maridesulfovibrio sp.]